MTALELLVCEIVGSGLSVSAIPVDRRKTNYRLTIIYPGGHKGSMEGPVSALEEWWRGDDKERAIKALEEEVAELSDTIGIRDKQIAEIEMAIKRARAERWPPPYSANRRYERGWEYPRWVWDSTTGESYTWINGHWENKQGETLA